MAVDLRLLVDVYGDWRTWSRPLRSEGGVCDVRMVALPTHLYSELSNVMLTMLLCNKMIYIRIEVVKMLASSNP